MHTTVIKLKQSDNYITYITHYKGDCESKASVLILHGMAEYHERYDAFANYLVNDGYDVYLYDHRGHGLKEKKHNLGFFADNNGHKTVVNDALHVITSLKNTYSKGKPFFLMGHSMGSLVTRNVIQQYDDLTGVILCGTAHPKQITTTAGHAFIHVLGYSKKKKQLAPTIDRIMFGGKQYKTLNKTTNFDWLSRDKNEVTKYVNDPYCGFLCTYSFYHDLICLTKNASTPKAILKTKKELPILILSGTSDPVGSYGKDVKRLIQLYQKNGYQSISYHLYKDARHELLNETNRNEVMKDIRTFCNSQLI